MVCFTESEVIQALPVLSCLMGTLSPLIAEQIAFAFFYNHKKFPEGGGTLDDVHCQQDIGSGESEPWHWCFYTKASSLALAP